MRDIIPLMNKLESIDFLSWLKNRIQYRYQEKEQDINIIQKKDMENLQTLKKN